jgi:sulfide:quinone oxidoreductase
MPARSRWSCRSAPRSRPRPRHRRRQAAVVADQLIARHRQAEAVPTCDGKEICYIEFGHGRVARVEVAFRSGERPNGQYDEPSDLLLADKAEFRASRIRRWFDRNWTSY